MKKMKKAVSMFLALAMIASMCAFTFSVSAENSQVAVMESDYAIADKLSALEIVNVVEDENLGNYVKRSDMIAVLTKYLRLEGVGLDGSGSPFLDVSYSDENIGAYRALYWGGYIAGDENKMFRPDDFLTYNEAITFIINAMGYRPFAKRNGGYPAGYLYTANKYELIDGLRGSGNNPIPFCDLYRIIEASVLADAVTYRYAINEEDSSFSLNKNMSVLEELYGYSFVNGVVTGNENTRIYSQDSSKIDRYQIEIENVVYETPGKEFANLLGKRVYAYLKSKTNGTGEIVYIEPVQGVNTEYKVSANKIFKDKTTSSRIFYETENLKEKYIDLNATSLSVVYNGKSHSGYGQLKNIMPDSGYILGIDNTGDKVVDVLFIYEFENIVVGAIDTINKKVYDKYITTNYETLDSYVDEVRIYNEDGETISFSDIAKGDVLSVMKSANLSDYKLVIVYNEHKVIEGTVSERVDNKYKIGDEYYETAANFDTYVANSKINPVVPGLNATFFLDYEGKIANYEETVTTDLSYGFLAGIDPESGLKKSIDVMIYTEKGIWLEASLAQKVLVDEQLYDINKDADFASVQSALTVGEIVLYKAAGDTISKIDTRNGDGDLTVVAEGAELFKRGTIAYSIGDMPQDSFVALPSAIIFNTPDPSTLLADTEMYEVKQGFGSKSTYTTDDSGDDNEKIDGFVAYKIGDKNDVNTATCVLFKNVASLQEAAALSTADLGMGIYIETTQVVDDEGETRKKIYVLEDGKKQGYMVNESKLAYKDESGNQVSFTLTDANLGAGDIVQYALNTQTGMIENISIAYRTSGNVGVPAAKITSVPGGSVALSSPFGALFGASFVGADVESNAIMVYGTSTAQAIGTGNLLLNTSGASITLYNRALKEETKVSLSDLIYGDDLIIRCSYYGTNATEIIAIR